MKSSIDLTESKDFDPEKFKVNRVKSRYYNGNIVSRTPWDNDGNMMTNRKVSYWNSITNMGWTMSWTNNVMDAITLLSETMDPIVDDWDLWNAYMPSTSTSLYNSDLFSTSSTSSYYIPRLSRFYSTKTFGADEFRLGKVSVIRRGYRALPTKKYAHRKCDSLLMDYYSDTYRHSKTLDNSRKMFKYARKYNGFEDKVEELTVGEYRELDYFALERSDYVLCELHRRLFRRPKSLISKERDNSRKMKWHDFHEDYLREQMGLRPRRDWLTGERVSQFLAV